MHYTIIFCYTRYSYYLIFLLNKFTEKNDLNNITISPNIIKQHNYNKIIIIYYDLYGWNIFNIELKPEVFFIII